MKEDQFDVGGDLYDLNLRIDASGDEGTNEGKIEHTELKSSVTNYRLNDDITKQSGSSLTLPANYRNELMEISDEAVDSSSQKKETKSSISSTTAPVRNQRRKYTLRSKSKKLNLPIDPTYIPKKLVGEYQIKKRSSEHAKVCPILKDSYKQLHVAKEDRETALLLEKEAEEEVKEAENRLQKAKDKLVQAKERVRKEEEILTRAVKDVEDAELRVPCPWNRHFAKLKEYKEKNGHIDLPARCHKDKELDILCIWLARQKQQYQKYREGRIKTKKPYRVAMLENLGVNWTIRDDRWDKNFAKLVTFKAKFGTTIVPTKSFDEDKNFAHWVTVQRFEYKRLKEGKKSQLTTERVQQLIDVGFVWNVFDEKWRQMYYQFISYKNEYGHLDVPERYPQNPGLSKWIARQRMEYRMILNGEGDSRKCKLTDERIKLLQDIGFKFEVDA